MKLSSEIQKGDRRGTENQDEVPLRYSMVSGGAGHLKTPYDPGKNVAFCEVHDAKAEDLVQGRSVALDSLDGEF